MNQTSVSGVTSNSQRVRAALSDLIGLGLSIMAPAPPARDRQQQLVALRTGVFEAHRLVLEGGNPIGPEAKMLAEVLEHIDQARRQFDGVRAEKWRAIGIALIEMVQGNLADAIEREAAPVENESGRYR
jgi:hypothetical protein